MDVTSTAAGAALIDDEEELLETLGNNKYVL